MEIITSEENIGLAYRNIKVNKGSKTAGVDGKTIVDMKNWDRARLITSIQKSLEWYVPNQVRRVEIPKSDGKKRPLGIPTIRDRLIQQSIMQVLEPICEGKFHERSNGFRPNRSAEHAIAQAMTMIQQRNLYYVVDIDIKGFFDNVSHGKLLKQIWTLGIRDKKLISIISTMLKAEVAGIGFPEKGTPQGGMISPLLSNIVKLIYDRFLAGDSLKSIANRLEELKILTPAGKTKWACTTIQSILSNEKYKGDVIINKTYIVDCISKEVRINNGEREKYYVENNHPAIIDAGTFGRVQEELARRASKPKVKQVGTKTEQGRYSSKYALTELLVCGECKTPYRRCTWTLNGQKKIVWRCINRLDFGKKYCHKSPTVEERTLHEAIMDSVMKVARQNADILNTLKMHIAMGLETESREDKTLDIQIRIAEIETEFNKMLESISAETVESFDETKAKELLNEKESLQQDLTLMAAVKQRKENEKSRLDEIYTVIDGLKNHPLVYDNEMIRRIVECVVVESKEKIKVIFKGGLEVESNLNS